MQKIIFYFKSRKIIILITFLFLFIRIPFLDDTFLLYDERDTVLTQLSLAKTGKDLYGVKMPLFFDHISPHAPILAMYYGVLFWKLGLPLTVYSARLIYLLPSTLLPLLIFEFIYMFTHKKKESIITAVFFSFSPWVYHISRLALEINIAFPLFLIGLISQYKQKYILSWLFYSLSFFSYQGIRPLIPIVFIYFEFWNIYRTKACKKSFVTILFFAILFLSLMFIGSKIEQNTVSRSSSEILLFATDRLKKEVDFNRSLSHNLFSNIFDNKITLAVDYLLKNLFFGFNFSYLFKTGDYVPIYSNSVTGQFIPLMAFFFLFGVLFLGYRMKNKNFFLAGLSIIGLIPSLINIYSTSFSIRSLFSGIGLSYIMTLGFIFLVNSLKKQKRYIRYSIYGALCAIYIYSTAGFAFKYKFHRSVQQAELFNETERKLGLAIIKKQKNTTVILSNPFSYFLSYIFLNQNPPVDFNTVQSQLKNNKDTFTINGITFMKCEINSISFIKLPENNIYDELCLTDKTKTNLAKIDQSLFETIQYSDINLLRSGSNIKFYIFN